MSSNNDTAVGVVVSGVIAAVIGVAATYLLSLVMPMPWGLRRTMAAVAVATFVGSAVSFIRGQAAGRRSR